MYTELFSEVHEVLADYQPLLVTAGTMYPVVAWAGGRFHRLVFIAHVGQVVGDLDMRLVQFNPHTYVTKVVPGKVAPRITNDSSRFVLFELRCEEIDVAHGFTDVGLEIVVSNTAMFSAIALGIVPRYAPVWPNHLDVVIV